MMIIIGCIIGYLLCGVLTILVTPFFMYVVDSLGEHFSYKSFLADCLATDEEDGNYAVYALMIWPVIIVVGIPWTIAILLSIMFNKLSKKLSESSEKSNIDLVKE